MSYTPAPQARKPLKVPRPKTDYDYKISWEYSKESVDEYCKMDISLYECFIKLIPVKVNCLSRSPLHIMEFTPYTDFGFGKLGFVLGLDKSFREPEKIFRWKGGKLIELP